MASGGTPESLGWGRLGLLLGEGWAAKKDGKKGGKGGGKGKIIKEKKIKVKKKKGKGKEEKPKRK